LSSGSQKRRLGKEHLQRIINMCQSIEQRGIDPFLVEVDSIIPIIHEYFPEWHDVDELCLDAEALHQVASAIELQSIWVKQRSTSLYTDPFIIEDKLRRLPKEEVCTLFLKSWHPIVEFEQISPKSLHEAAEYWRDLLPLNERWEKGTGAQTETGTTTHEELLQQQIISDKKFSTELETLWQELKLKTENSKKVDYWDFIGAETYEETVRRAYITSFLVTYGYATLEIDRLEEIIFIKPKETPNSAAQGNQAYSVPILVGFEEWESWRRGERE